jgi:hypothetical protein
MLINTDVVKKIYRALADDESKKVFLSRVNYLTIQDSNTLIELARTYYPEFIDKVMSFVQRGNKVAVYGAGNEWLYYGRVISITFKDYLLGLFDKRFDDLKSVKTASPIYATDSSKELEFEVLNPEKLLAYANDVVVIIATPTQKYQDEIFLNLVQRYGIPQEKILVIPPIYLPIFPTYFHHAFLTYGKDEAFVDCGGYKGETSEQFVEAVFNYNHRCGGATFQRFLLSSPSPPNMRFVKRLYKTFRTQRSKHLAQLYGIKREN